MTLFFTSDHHFSHANILSLMNRPFKDVEEMDRVLIQRWNAKVKPQDTVYHLGDLTLTRTPPLKQLNGKIHVLHTPKHHDERWIQIPQHARLHPVTILPPLVQLKVTHKQRPVHLALCHFPLVTWNRKHHKGLHLHGHSHGKLKPHAPYMLDVGVDAHDFYPMSLAEILSLTKHPSY